MSTRFRDELYSYVVPWLSDRSRANPPRSTGFRFLWSMVAPLDAAMDVIVQGIQAAWPGQGTPTALDSIGNSRGIIRGQVESDDAYALRLQGWLDRWRIAGSSEALARSIHEYLGNAPRVRVISRSGKWVTINADGSLVRSSHAWDWDSVSNPERAGYWSELFVVVYPTQWAARSNFDSGGHFTADGLGFGHLCNRTEYDAVNGLCAQWKAEHSRVRCVIWTSDATLFDPTNPASLPNGNWGTWGVGGTGARVPSDRNLTTCRYWEPQ